MPLSDLFRKSSKPESPGHAPGQGTAFQNKQVTEVIKSVAANSIDGAGDRLILGEGMLPMQASLESGGKYILVHPAILRELQQRNIDPFLIYEAALRMELASRIRRIDLIGGDIDQFIQAWNNRPRQQAPMHVRQVLWLAENANASGYERSGNSWILKS